MFIMLGVIAQHFWSELRHIRLSEELSNLLNLCSETTSLLTCEVQSSKIKARNDKAERHNGGNYDDGKLPSTEDSLSAGVTSERSLRGNTMIDQ